MDYILFEATQDGKVHHLGRIDSVRNVDEARRKLKKNAYQYMRGRAYFLVNAKDFIRVKT